jgi:uncharacterized OB-fold protein
MTAAESVPLVDYLVLGDEPHLLAKECAECGAVYFDRRNACARCFGGRFTDRRVDNAGALRTFTIVSRAAPGVSVPFVAGVVDCGGIDVRANVVNVPADPEHISLGMKVRMTTFRVAVAENGTEAIGFGFEPAEEHS